MAKRYKSCLLWLFAASLFLNILFMVGAAGQWYSLRPMVATAVRTIKHIPSTLSNSGIEEIVGLIESQDFQSYSEKIDFIRNWVHVNSVHLIDTEHDAYAFDTSRVLGMLWKTHHTGQNQAHLSCGPRSLAMKAILDELNIKSRVVMIFTDDNDQVNSHTFLEVFNPESNYWVVHDADFNIYYVDQETQKRVSAARLIWSDLNTVIPVSNHQTGWKDNQVEHLKHHYFEALLYANHLYAKKSVVLVNQERFNPSKTFTNNNNSNFYQFAKEHYGNPSFVTNQGF